MSLQSDISSGANPRSDPLEPEPAVVVLGGSGFIGTRLVRHLHSTRAGPIRALDILPPRERLQGVDYHVADVREPLDPSHGIGASVIYNLAAVHRTPGHDDYEYFETNVAGAVNCTAFAEVCDIRTIVFTSSISVYGACEELVFEGSPLKPNSAYGRSKRLAERIHRTWLDRGDERRLIIARPGVVFGPGEIGNYTTLARALRRGIFFYPGRRDTVKSGGLVDELLLAIDFALKRDERSILFNFAYPTPSSVQTIVETLGRVIGRPAKPMTVPASLLLAVAAVFELANALGIRNAIHRERVLKLVNSTKVDPCWLKSAGYSFSTDLEAALCQWRDETEGRFD